MVNYWYCTKHTDNKIILLLLLLVCQHDNILCKKNDLKNAFRHYTYVCKML